MDDAIVDVASEAHRAVVALDGALEDYRENGRLRLEDGSPAYADLAVASLCGVEPTRTLLLTLVAEAKRLGIVDAILDTPLEINALEDVLTLKEGDFASASRPESAEWNKYLDTFESFVDDWLGGSRAGKIALGKLIDNIAMPDAVAGTYDDMDQSALGGALLFGDKRLPTTPRERKLYRNWTNALPGKTNQRAGKILQAARQWAAVWTTHSGVLVDAIASQARLFRGKTSDTLSRAINPFNRQFGLRCRRAETAHEYRVKYPTLRVAPTRDKFWIR